MRGCGTIEYPVQVGLYATGNSPFGVWDMAGNVWEWTNDWFDANYYATDPTTNPAGPWSGDFKIIRGGGWNSANDKVRSANRFAIEPQLSFKDVGFRCVANTWAEDPGISVPEESHGRRAGDGRSVEEEPGSPSHELRLINYGIPSSACGAGDTIVFGIAAQNSFGASYVAEIDGNPMTCLYRSNYLLCTAPRRTAATPEGGRLVYRVTIHMVDSGGTRLPDATYGASFTIAGTHFSSCIGSASVEVTHRENAVCGSAPGPARVVTTVVSPNIIPGTIFLNDAPLSGCIPTSGSMFLCPVPDSVAAGTATLHVVGTLTDGIQPVDYTATVTIPDCSRTPGSGDPSFTFTATCDASGRYLVDFTYTPASLTFSEVAINSRPARCALLAPGLIRCSVSSSETVRGIDGRYYLAIMATLNPAFTMPDGSLLVEAGQMLPVPTCEGGGTSGGGSPMMPMGAAYPPAALGIGFDVTFPALQPSGGWCGYLYFCYPDG